MMLRSMEFEHILVQRSGDFATVTMNRPQRRNALSLAHMRELITAFRQIGDSDALGAVLAGNGPVFSAGHDFADVADAVLADRGDRSRLDLRRVVVAQLGAGGLELERISATHQNPDGGAVFFSDRAARPCGRFALVAKRAS